MMKETIEILIKEHKNILSLAEALSHECDLIKRGKNIDENFFVEAIDFIKNYADKFHHAKEEDILFKEFEKFTQEGCLHCNPIAQMLVEHDEGRIFVKGMKESLSNKEKDDLIKNTEGYIVLIKEHIFKEDNILYPMIDDVLSDEVEKIMLDKFNKIAVTNKNHEEYSAYIKKLKIRQ